MFWCVLCGMQFAILYGMLDVYTNPVLSSTRLNWYKTFDFKSQWVIYFATPPPNPQVCCVVPFAPLAGLTAVTPLCAAQQDRRVPLALYSAIQSVRCAGVRYSLGSVRSVVSRQLAHCLPQTSGFCWRAVQKLQGEIRTALRLYIIPVILTGDTDRHTSYL